MSELKGERPTRRFRRGRHAGRWSRLRGQGRQKKEQRTRVRAVLEEVARLSQGRKFSQGVRWETRGCRVRVVYYSGSGDVSAPIDQHRFDITVRRKWAKGRVNIHRKPTKELRSHKQIDRLEAKLAGLPREQAGIVVEALTEIPGGFRLTRSGLYTNLGPFASAHEVSDRVDVMAGFLERLAVASPG